MEDLLHRLTVEQRRILLQKLSDEYYEAPITAIPTRDLVAALICQLGFR